MKTSLLAGSVLLALASTSVYAGAITQVSEPGTLELLAIAAVAAIVVAIRKRRK